MSDAKEISPAKPTSWRAQAAQLAAIVAVVFIAKNQCGTSLSAPPLHVGGAGADTGRHGTTHVPSHKELQDP